jgi:hypothetical protein
LVIEFINNLQVVTTNNYSTPSAIQNLQSPHTNLLSYFHQSPLSTSWQRNYNTGTIKVSLNYTLPIPLNYSAYKVLKLHIKSSQVDEIFVAVSYRELRTVAPFVLR